jgi:uncharacterized protein
LDGESCHSTIFDRNARSLAMARNVVFGLLMMATTAFVSSAALADEPSLHQVYQAAEAGKLVEAQTMMHEVLKTHPNSGKAHFVEAELLAKQGQRQQAETELATAERLAPGLPFAKPEAVQRLRGLTGSSPRARQMEAQSFQTPPPASETAVPWGMLFIGLGLIAFIIFAVRLMSRRNAMPSAADGRLVGAGPGNVSPAYGQPMHSGAGPAGGVAGSGLGSSLMSGLATGAAVGAGVVAGEALMHHFMDGRGDGHPQAQPLNSGLSSVDTSLDEMGGADFGVSDTSSWDDSSGGGSDDWN